MNIKTTLNTVGLAFDSIKNISASAYIGSSGLFATDALKAYATQLGGLTATQQKMALMTTNLTAAQRQQVLSYMAETAAAKTLTAQQISELSIDQQKVLVNAGLITQDGLKTGSTITLTKAELQKIIADDAILAKDKQLILSAFGVTEANLTEASSWEILGKSAGKALLSLATNPVTWAVAGVVAITAVTNAIWDTTKEIEERLEETKNGIQETESEISSIEQQIEANTQKLEEMRAAGMDESALQTYVKENEELNSQLQLLKDINEEAKKKIAPDVAKLVNNEGKQTAISKAFDQLMSGDIGGIIGDSVIGNLFSGAYFKSGGLEKFGQNLAQMNSVTSLLIPFSDPDDDIIARTNDALKDYKKYQEEFDNLNETDFKSKEAYWEKQQELSGKIGESSSIIGTNISQLLEYRKELANSDGAETYYADEIQKIDNIIKSYYSANPQSAFDYIFSQDSFSEVKSKLDDFSKSGLGELRKGIQDLIPVNGELYNKLVDFGLIAENSENWVDELATNFDFLSVATEGAGENVDEMTVSLEKMSDASKGISTIAKAFDELNSDDGFISIETIASIKEELGDSVENWEEYERILLTAKKGSAKASETITDLTYAMLDQKFAGMDLTSVSEEYVAAILRENGVTNDVATAHDYLMQARAGEMATSIAQGNTTAANIQNLMDEAGYAGQDALAMYDLVAAEIYFNNHSLDVTQKVNALYEIAAAAGVARNAIISATDLNAAMQKQDGKYTQSSYNKLAELGITYTENKNRTDSNKTSKNGHLYHYNGADYEKREDAIAAAAYDKANKGIDSLSGNSSAYVPTIPKYTPTSAKTNKGSGKDNSANDAKKAANDAKKAAEDAKRAEEERQRKELEALQAGLDARKKVLERYKASIELTDFGLELIDEDDFGLKSNLLSEKLDQLTTYGKKMRAEFDRVAATIPATGEQADALGNRLEELGSDMRSNVTEIRKVTIELQKLSIDMATTVVEDRIGELQAKLKSIDKQTELLNSGYKDDFDHLNDMLSFDSMLPSYSSFSKERSKSSASNKDIIKSEQKTQDTINDIIETQIEKNEKLREDERQAILADMDTMRQDTVLKLETVQADYETHVGVINTETDSMVSYVTNAVNNMELKFPKPDTTEFGKAADEVKKSLETVTKLLGITPGAYATGTTKGNQQASTLGIAGENYKPEILIDKKTGATTYIDSPTVIDTSKTDVVGEQATASLPKFAKGTVGDITSEPHGMSKLCEGLRNVAKYAKGYGAVYAARQFLGKPYVWGGTSESGVDCSGLTYLAWKRMGVDIGRTTYVQYPNSTKISASELKPGDLVFSSFGARDNDGPGHVGMYVANGRTIESPRTGDVVKYSSIGKWTAYGRPKYASGTPDGNAQVKNLGLAGENYKPEILIDKNSGEMRYIDKPTVIDISKTDVIGEKATAKLPKFATGSNIPLNQLDKLTVEQIKVILSTNFRNSSKLNASGAAEGIYKAQQNTGVSALALLAIAAGESGWGTSKVAVNKNNYWGWNHYPANGKSAYERATTFSSDIGTAFEDYANKLVKSGYASQSIVGMAMKYCPDGTWDKLISGTLSTISSTLSSKGFNEFETSSGTSTETTKEKTESEKISDNIDKAYEEIVSGIGEIEAKYIKEIHNITNDKTKDDIQKNREKADILYKIDLEASKKITEAYNKLAEEFYKWIEDVKAGTKEWNYEIYMAYKDGLQNYNDTATELAQNAWETISEAADKDWEISSRWIEERNKKGDWNLFNDSESEAWGRVIKWLEDNYPKETEKLKEATDNKIEAEWNNSSNWIEERKERGDWSLYWDSEADAWGRVVKWLEEKYPHEQAKLREAIKNQSDARWNERNEWIDERNQYNDWELFGTSEVEAWEDVIRNLNRDEPDYIARLKEAELKLFEARKKEFTDANNFATTYIESQKTLLQSYYNVTNAIADAQHDINKELEQSKTMYEYLDEDTRKLLFNQEDYNRLTEELLDIQDEADILQRRYERDLRNSTAETVSKITADYERQYQTLMKSYEVAKADLEIAKKKQKLNNVLNERNVRMFVNGSWQWVANAENVTSAKAELADAEYSRQKTKTEIDQQNSLNTLTKRQENLNVVIKQFEAGVVSLAEAVGLAKDSVKLLPEALREEYELAGVDTKSYTTGASSRSVDGAWYESNVDYSDRIANAKTFEEASQINPTRNTKISGDGLPYLPYIIPELGAGNEADILWNTTITEFGKDNEADMFWIRKYASGSKNTQGGIALMGEEESETFITSKGRLIPITQPTVGNISSGGVVFNTDQMKNLRTLWDMSNLNLNPDRNYLSGLQPQQIDQRQDNRIIINGMTVDSGSADGQALIGALRRYVGNH